MIAQGFAYSILCMLAYALTNIFFKLSANMELNPFLTVAISSIVAGLLLLAKGGPSNLAKNALKSKYTWLYGISEFLDLCFVMSISYFVSATEGALVTRLAIIVSVVFAHFFLKRSAFKREYIGLLPVIVGLILVFSGIDELAIVLALSIMVAIARNVYYFSIELHPVAAETKNMVQDYSVIGYIVSAAGLAVLTVLFAVACISELAGYQVVAKFPMLHEFASVELFVMSIIFGSTFLFATKVLEFKSIQLVKTEMFNCITAFSPLATFFIELMLSQSDFYTTKIELSFVIILATLLIVSGGAYVFYRRFANPMIEDETEIKDIRDLVISATLYCKDDYQVAANKLGISLSTLHDIMDSSHDLVIRKDVFDRIEHRHHKYISMSDPLTGLVNRLQFMTQLKGSECKELSLLFIDLNKFKAVNDTYGHDAGDYILSSTAARLLKYIKANELEVTLTRLGGDEFCMLVRNGSINKAKKIANEVVPIICEPYNFDGVNEPISVGAAIGVAHYPSDTDDREALIGIADKNMYKDKENR